MVRRVLHEAYIFLSTAIVDREGAPRRAWMLPERSQSPFGVAGVLAMANSAVRSLPDPEATSQGLSTDSVTLSLSALLECGPGRSGTILLRRVTWM